MDKKEYHHMYYLKVIKPHRQKHVKEYSEYQKKYCEEHREELKEKRKYSRHRRKYQLAKIDLYEIFSAEEWKEKVDATNGICPSCGNPYEERYGLTLNHIPPISKAPPGFQYTINDVEPMCCSCNAAKKNNF